MGYKATGHGPRLMSDVLRRLEEQKRRSSRSHGVGRPPIRGAKPS